MTFRSTTRETTTIGQYIYNLSLNFRNAKGKVLFLLLSNRLVMNDYQQTSFESIGGAREVSQHQAVYQQIHPISIFTVGLSIYEVWI